MRTAAGQYAHLVAIMFLMVAPAVGLHPLFGVVVAWFAFLAWGFSSPLTNFDEALGNVIIAMSRELWRAVKTP